MNFGTHSTVEYLAIRLLHRWVPKWYEAFSDPKTGGFYERLGHSFRPVQTGSRRLLTQCRQLSIYSHAMLQPDCPDFGADLKKNFEHILARYYNTETGLWRFSLDDDGNIADENCDLYSITFVIFSFSYYFRLTGDARAREYAIKTIDMIDKKFRSPHSGFVECLDGRGNPLPQMRRQNPHMHLLEACLFAHETWGDLAWLSMAGEMVALFHGYFFDDQNNALHEFFTDDLKPHAEKGGRVEPGHYFEWIWLLKRYATAMGDAKRYDALCARLLVWGNAHGWDETHGGIYDVVSPDGKILVDTKRLWPFTEALKANAMMLDSGPDKDAVKTRINEMVRVFKAQYMQERGFWVEWLSRDLKPQTDYMPGTTPYHVYFGIMETRRHLHARGYSVSLVAPVMTMVYKARRTLSMRVRAIRFFLKKIKA